MSIDVDAYFQRIGHGGERAPTLDTLRAIVARHSEAIPFENLDPLLGRPVLLDAASLERKLVRGGRGGYCFEQNLLLRHALEALGFAVTALAARVLWNAPEGVTMPRTHALLLVDLGGEPHLVDVGFGGMTLTGVLRLELGVEQPTPHEPFRLLLAGEEYQMQARIGTSWKSLYRFDLQRQYPADYEVGNWYVSTHPRSHFVSGLSVARTVPGRRYALRNNELAVHHLGEVSERRVLTAAAELRQILERTFGLVLPEDPQLESALVRLAAGR